jgi:hypothetical protein
LAAAQTSSQTIDADLGQGIAQLRGAIVQSSSLAGQIERGQAAMPLRDYFEALSASLATAPFTLTLLGLDAASRAAALGWLCGEDYHVLSVEVPGAVGLVEVQLAERGYVLVKAGRRQEFDRLEPFLDAVRAADLVRQGDANAWLEPMHLEVAAPRGLQGLKLLMPESLASIAESPALLARLRSDSNLLVVAGPVDYRLDGPAADAIRGLAADALATWAISCGPVPPDFSGRGWSDGLDGSRLPPVHLDAEAAPPPAPEFLLDGQSGIRQGLFACQHARRFESALDLLEERAQQDLRQHDARRKMLVRRAASLNDAAPDRALAEALGPVRRMVEERRAKLEAALAEGHRERLLPTAIPNNQINNLLEDLTAEDIAKETLGRVVQLSVAPRVRQEVRRLVGDLIRGDLHADLERLDREVKAIGEEAVARVEAAGGGSLSIVPEMLEESTVWKSLEESIHLDSRYRGELAHKGRRERLFSMEFLMHCRMPFLAMMSVMTPILVFWEDLRKPLLRLAPLLFLTGAFLAFRGMQEEEHKAEERELVRLRDTLRSEIRRLYEQALGDWSKRAGQHLNGVVNGIGQQVDEHLRVRVAEKARESGRERVALQDKLKVVDHRIHELGGLAQQVGRVRQSAVEARQVLERSAREAIRDVRETVKVS